jgi:hypothetical protein
MAEITEANQGAAVPRETRSNIKLFPYLPPRIDQEMFQAEIPPLQSAVPSYDKMLWARPAHKPACQLEAVQGAREPSRKSHFFHLH